MMVPPPGPVNFRPVNKRRMIKRKELEPEPVVDGGTPLPFPYSSKDWLGKTPKSYVMEYFQRSNLQPPKWIRESHSTRQLHLIKVTFQDQTGKEVTLYADRYFRSVKDAEHNTSILVLCHLMPGAKDPKDIIDRMTQLQNLSKLQKRRRQETRPLRMGAYSFKQKMYSRTGPPHNLYPAVQGKGGVPNKQYENYGYGYDVYDPNAFAQDYSAYNAYYQAGYGYDYSGTYNAAALKTDPNQATSHYTGLQSGQRLGYADQTAQAAAAAAGYAVQIPETPPASYSAASYSAQAWAYPETPATAARSYTTGYNPYTSY